MASVTGERQLENFAHRSPPRVIVQRRGGLSIEVTFLPQIPPVQVVAQTCTVREAEPDCSDGKEGKPDGRAPERTRRPVAAGVHRCCKPCGLPDVGDGSPDRSASDVKRAVSSEGAVTRAGARHSQPGAVPAKASWPVHEGTGQVAGQFVELRFTKIGKGGTQDCRHIDPDFLQSGNDRGSDSPPLEAGLRAGLDRDKRIEDLHGASMPCRTVRLRVTSVWPCISCFSEGRRGSHRGRAPPPQSGKPATRSAAIQASAVAALRLWRRTKSSRMRSWGRAFNSCAMRSLASPMRPRSTNATAAVR